MSNHDSPCSSSTTLSSSQNKFKGIRRRKWGKWVSEIRVPGTSHRLWLGSYTTPEAAAVAHDVAFFCLRGNSSPQNLNFPLMLPAGARAGMSPRSVQQAASDAGLAIDARYLASKRLGEDDDGKRVMDYCATRAPAPVVEEDDDDEEEEEEEEEEDQRSTWRQHGADYRRGNDEGYLNVSVEDYL